MRILKDLMTKPYDIKKVRSWKMEILWFGLVVGFLIGIIIGIIVVIFIQNFL